MSIKSQKVPLSASDLAARLRRIGRALKQGTELQALRQRGFSDREIERAREMYCSGADDRG